MEKYIEVSNLPNFEVTCSDGKKYVLLPFEHLSDIPTADVVPKSEVEKAKAEVARVFAEKVKPLFERIVELMFDGDESTCKVENCQKPDSMGCGDRICINENIAWWNAKVDDLVKEFTEEPQ